MDAEEQLVELVADKLISQWAADKAHFGAEDKLLMRTYRLQSAQQRASAFEGLAELVASRDLATIVVPAYNAAAYVCDTLDSLIAQTHPRVQIVVVDDGSTDDTPRILARYQEQHGIEVIRLPQNSGIACAKNAGIKRARGKWLGFLSADDVYKPEAIATLLRALYMNPDAGLAYGDFELFSESEPADGHARIVKLRPLDLPDLFAPGITVGMCALFRKSLLDQLDGPVEETKALDGVEDTVLWQDLWRHTRFVHVPQVLGRYRLHAGQFTRRIMRSGGYGPLLARSKDRFAERYGEPHRLLFVYPSCCLGGAERVMSDLAVGLRGHGVSCEACFMEDGGGVTAWSSVCPTLILDELRGEDSRPSALADVIKNGNYEVIQYSFVGEMAEALEVADFPGVVVEVSHGWTKGCQAERVRPDALVAVSEFQAEELRQSGVPAPIQVIHNGVDVTMYAGYVATLATAVPKPARPIIAWAGRVSAQKRLSLFLDVARQLAALRADLEFYVAGSIAYTLPEDVVQLNRACQELPHFRFFAGLNPSDMPAFYARVRASDGILVMTSADEPFGMVVLEAMASGIPVVASRSGGIPEIIEDGVDGILIPEPYSASEAAQVVLRMLGDKTGYASFAGRAVAKVGTRFPLASMVQKYWDLFASLCGWQRTLSKA